MSSTDARPTDGLAFAPYEEIFAALEPYVAAARTGSTAGLRASFEDDARIEGWIDGRYLCLDPDAFTDWVAQNGSSPDLQFRVVSIDYSGLAAAVRVEFENWLGFRFTDFFTLVRREDGWGIASKVYYAHGRTTSPDGAATAPADAGNFEEAIDIARIIDAYVDGARRGDRAKLRDVWSDHARIVGRIDGAPVRKDPDAFCAQVAEGGGAPNMRAQVVSIDRSGLAASGRIEINDWNGDSYTDFFTLLKGPEGWRVSGKAFDAPHRR